MADNNFLFKPVSESDGNLVVLTPNTFNDRINQVEIISPDGNVVSTGRFAGNEHNGQRGHFRFDSPGSSFAGNQVRVTFDDGREPLTLDIGDGSRFTQAFSPEGGITGDRQEGGGPRVISSGGNSVVDPRFVDFSTLQAPNVNFDQRFSEAQDLAAENRSTFFSELTGEDARNAALGLVGTDVEGITNAVNSLAPLIREQGDQDTQTNIDRAGEIDAANISRIPALNRFNRQQTALSNEFNQAQQAAAVGSSGLNFTSRITDVLNRLEQRATGNLPEELDASLTTSLRNRGSELALSTGSGALSGAGIRANDRLTVQERVNLAVAADAALPGVLTGAQSVLQAPVQQAPTLFAQPTEIPLNLSQVASKIPVTSSISAGSAQLSIAQQATDIGTIPAETFLSGAVSVDQFNEQQRFARDKFVLQAGQDQLTAQDVAAQNLINANKADEIRAGQAAAVQEGLDIRQASQEAAAQGAVAGGIQALGSLGGLGSGGFTGSLGIPSGGGLILRYFLAPVPPAE